MKKFTVINISIWAITVLLCVIGMCLNGNNECKFSHTYQVMAICTEITEDGAILTDTLGEMWYVEVPLMLGQEYLMSIDDYGTNTLEDDEILNIWREVRGQDD